MPQITVGSQAPFEVARGSRLVNALEDHGIDILHRCGGNARCTTCRVEFQAGEPNTITKAESFKLAEAKLTGVRLACQITCEADMQLHPLMTLSDSGLPDPGPRPADSITPEPEWLERPL
ncbi:2Fe-2S iron-sulfur cluster-binding protein [Herpetosiphon llansteffanensis]|uniref:2Fe-2S iron-sulfur cluster-binding protein n=1 Tax=Herpetosiphon llansteffanensis TaxID=2094568 RepID=UPI000D7C6B32|nr:2Fe-2S iron-sulfur cluster-binding protein [Herpetosiphon llansteffanensis]